jgi:biopolymer transport protein ExbD
MRRAKKFEADQSSEFDLDLAPLLSVMVKLVPVLLLSSAFVQLMVIETELPQAVQQAIQKQEQAKDIGSVTIEASPERVLLFYTQAGKTETVEVKANTTGVDYEAVHNAMVQLKLKDPRIFKIELNPSENLPYSDIVRIMDEARRVRDSKVRFKIESQTAGQTTETDYMFPEIVFGNTLEG